MVQQRYALCIVTAVCFAYAEANSGNAMELTPSGVLEVDILQSLAENDKQGGAGVGRLEAGLEASVGKNVEAALFFELGDEDAIRLLETWFTFKPTAVLSLSAGQCTMPFGEYATELLTDPLVKCGYENDSCMIPGAETIAPGFVAGAELAGFSASCGVYNSGYTQRFEAFAVKLGYSFTEIISAGICSRIETSRTIDIAADLCISLISFLSINGEIYADIKNKNDVNKLSGLHGEIDIMPKDPLVIAVRFGRLVNSRKNGHGSMQIAGGAKYAVNDHVTFSIEFNGTAEISNGERRSFDNLGVRIGCAIE